MWRSRSDRGGEGPALNVQAAAGIVADSDPRSEWLETQHKARALLRAAEIADAGQATQN